MADTIICTHAEETYVSRVTEHTATVPIQLYSSSFMNSKHFVHTREVQHTLAPVRVMFCWGGRGWLGILGHARHVPGVHLVQAALLPFAATLLHQILLTPAKTHCCM